MQQRNQSEDIAALQHITTMDTAKIMARYGANLALAGSTSGSPLMAGAAATSAASGKAPADMAAWTASATLSQLMTG